MPCHAAERQAGDQAAWHGMLPWRSEGYINRGRNRLGGVQGLPRLG